MEQIITLRHLGIDLLVWRINGRLATSLHPLCEALDISSEIELTRLQATPVFKEHIQKCKHNGVVHHFVPVRLLIGWLVMIDESVKPNYLPLLHQLQNTASIAIWSLFYGILCNPRYYIDGNPDDYRSRNFIYNCPLNAVQEIELSCSSPADLAIATLQQLREIFQPPGNNH
ncbi:TPA: hypothetical protein R4057_002015 [Kluyvera ascorbata]|nr:hypothetical protein [Kluyvera ascorbata]